MKFACLFPVYGSSEHIRCQTGGVREKGMSLIDSEAALKQRCEGLGAEAVRTALDAQGIKTFASLAYACGTPQEKPSATEFDAFCRQILGAAPQLGPISMLKRLHFEAVTYVIAQLRQNVAGESSESPKKIPLAEKAARAQEQKTRLNGVNIERSMVPSHHLIDLCAHMLDQNCPMWIAPSKCTSRESELQHSSKTKDRLFRLQDQTLRVVDDDSVPSAECNSPIMLQWCWQRRGLALDQAKLVAWHDHERWVQTLLQALTRDPPPECHRRSLAEIIQADREAWMIMAEEVTSLQPLADGSMPLGTKLLALRTDPRIQVLLMPMPGKAPAAHKLDETAPSPGAGDGTSRAARRRKRRQELKKKAPDAPPKNPRLTPPPELANCYQRTEHGRPICWEHNCKGCKEKTQGTPPVCRRGVHVCAFCRRANHAFPACRARSWRNVDHSKTKE